MSKLKCAFVERRPTPLAHARKAQRPATATVVLRSPLPPPCSSRPSAAVKAETCSSHRASVGRPLPKAQHTTQQAVSAAAKCEVEPPIGVTLPQNYVDHVVAHKEVLEEALFHEMNLLRRNPRQYAGMLQDLVNSMVDNSSFVPGCPYMYYCEGASVLRETVEILEGTPPLPPLAYSVALSRAAREHAADIGLTGDTGHTGSNGGRVAERVSRYAKWGSLVGEDIDYGVADAQAILLHLLVDDSVPDRGHRENLLNRTFLRAGVGIGAHKRFLIMTVITFAHDITEEKPPPPDEVFPRLLCEREASLQQPRLRPHDGWQQPEVQRVQQIVRTCMASLLARPSAVLTSADDRRQSLSLSHPPNAPIFVSGTAAHVWALVAPPSMRLAAAARPCGATAAAAASGTS
eukprot:TRINITY_DN1556_c0_g1_i1.p1 TRINITY_DN1556_c0_g1~~TRINITY_DN1556_c0_g1_i1.p1  ORF type:complete len:452 (-),score=104.36 TRINITY_DN1556_c0_g1_i1:488-1699(-)